MGVGKGNGELGPGWTRIAPHRKEGFQVREGAIKGVIKGELSKGVPRGCAMYIVSSTCIYVSCYCVNVANKRIVFRL